jgi:polyisoprenoid-binding protein YceI
VTSSIRGDVQANLADPAGKWHGSIHCNAGALRTGVDGRDENMREYLVTDKHPEISFELTGFAPDPNGIDVAGRTASGMVKGRMTIRGRTRDVEMPVAISIDESRRVAISGQMPLHLPDYEVPVPSQLGLISMDEEVMVWVELRARSVGAAEEAPDGR